MTTEVETSGLEMRIAALLHGIGSARLRTGERRTDAQAKALLQGGADYADLKVTITKGEGYHEANVK